MDRNLLRLTGIWALACAALVTAFYLFIDRPVDLAAHALHGGLIYRTATLVSLLADHTTFSVILTAAFLFLGASVLHGGMTPGLRLALYCCLAVTLAMLVGETVKWLLGRYRPEMLFEQGLYGFTFYSGKDGSHSFPSGHTFRIFSAMTALSLVLPRKRTWFLALACLVGISRVLVTRHYPSDVLAGAFLGVFAALWVWRIMGGEAGGGGMTSGPSGAVRV